MNKYQIALNNIKKEAGTPYFSSLYDIDDWKEDFKTLQELVDKETPMKEIQKEEDSYCPKCKALMMIMLPSYCWRCGQKLDWSDTDE